MIVVLVDQVKSIKNVVEGCYKQKRSGSFKYELSASFCNLSI